MIINEGEFIIGERTKIILSDSSLMMDNVQKYLYNKFIHGVGYKLEIANNIEREENSIT